MREKMRDLRIDPKNLAYNPGNLDGGKVHMEERQ